MFEGNFEVSAVDDLNYQEEILDVNGPVLVGITADWCGPGQALDALLQRLARELGRKLKVVQVDADRCRRFLASFRVEGVPTCLLLRKGEEADRIAGVQPYDVFKERVEQQLN